MKRGSLFHAVPKSLAEEQIDSLVARPDVRIERIVSTGQASAPGTWYDQEQDEWVFVLQGSAGLEFEDRDEPVEMTPGDWVEIRAHERHRVAWTSAHEPTVWLAVHFPGCHPRGAPRRPRS